MENQSWNLLTPVPADPSRTPLSENLILLQEGEHATEGRYEASTSGIQTKGRTLFADTGVFKHGENAWACTPNRAPTSTKANNSRQSLHGTPPRTRKRAGRQPVLTNDTEASSCDLNGQNTGLVTPASKALASLSPAPNVLFPQPARTPCPANLSSSSIQHFTLEQDKDFWKDHNVQVIIRIRPLNSAETAANGSKTCLRQESPHALTWLGQPESRFTFDHVACPSTTQEELFQAAGLPMVDNCIEGYNSSIFAYGQTGSGKTYTMLGDITAMNHKLNSCCGITPRIFEYLFTKIKMEEAAHRQEHLMFTCKCSFLQIYNEQITDLLEPTSTNLQIHENPRKGLFVENLKEFEVKNVGDVMELLLQGAANRRVDQTRMNQESSRSHSVFTCVIESQWVNDSTTSFRYGRLNLVDLAGSERQKASGAEGERLREAANINKSLSTLGLVIMILVDVAQGKQRHVPYRDSKLTFLLQDSLGGNSKTAIIATVSPAISCANETLSTLKFAQRAKFIQNNAVINEDASGDVKALQSQIQDLKKELEKLRDRTESLKNTQTSASGKALTEIAEGSLSSQYVYDFKKKQAIEEILAGCLRREQAAVQENNELAAENQQLNSLLQAYERDINYVKTMLQLKEDKIQRLKNVEDAVMSAEDCLQEENRSLQQELHLLKERMNKHPELLRFAFENKHLIQHLRRHDEFYGREREMLMAELANLRHQVLSSLQENLTKEKQKEEIESNTCQNVGHKKEDNQTADSKSFCPERLLVTKDDPQICNTISNFCQGEEAQTKMMSFLEEGDQALGEALQEIESMPRCTLKESENHQPTNSTHANTIHKDDHGVTGLLQQVFDMAKEMEGQFKVLCDVAVGENKRKRSESMKVLLSTWGDKRMKALQIDLTTITDASEVHKLDQNCSPNEKRNQVSLQDCSLSEEDWEFKHSMQSCEEAFSNEALADVHNDDFLYPVSKPRDEAKSKYFCFKVPRQREKQQLSAKMDLNHLALELPSDAIARDGKTSDLQYGEAILAANFGRLYKGEEGIAEDLISLKKQLEYSENQRLLGEQLYKQSLQDSKEHQIKASLKLQKLTTEVRDINHIFMIVRKQMEIALASLREAEISRKRMEEASKGFECTGRGKMKVDPLEKELDNAYQSVAQMQKQLMGMETEMTSMMAKLEGRLEETEAAWRGEKAVILMELDKTKLDAAEKIGEASEALEKFKGSQDIIREAELMVNALTKAYESARMQQLDIMNQWHEERQGMVTTIGELKSMIVQKEDELQMKEQEVQQLISKVEIVMVLAQKEISAFVPDGEERMNSTATVNMESNKITNMQELLAEISELNNHFFAQKSKPSELFNMSAKKNSIRIVAEELDSINMPIHENNHLGSTQDHFREKEQKQVTATEIEIMPFQYRQLKHKKAQEQARKSEEVAKLKHELEESTCNMLQAQNSHAMMKLILQGTEGETMLQGANLKECDIDEALGKSERANTFQIILQKTAVDIPLALQSYDESTSLLLEKLEGIVATLSDKPGGEDAWVRFLNSFKLALFKLEEDANSCLSFSNVICEKLDETLAEKQRLEQELERKQELLKGSFFDLSLLQESTAEYNNMKSKMDGAFFFIKSLQEELNIKNERLNKVEIEYANLQSEKMESMERIRCLETSLIESQQHTASMSKQNADMRHTMEDALREIVSLEERLEERRQTIEKLEVELLEINLLVERKMADSVESVKQQLSLTRPQKDQLQMRLFALEEQLDATRLAADTNKRLADEAKQIVETNKSHIQEKETEVKLLEKSVQELENTINALENQMEILKREAEIQQLVKEDLEMELQVLRHQQYHDPSSKNESSEDTKWQQFLTAQLEITTMRKELAEKTAEIKSLKLQVEDLITAAEKQATAHHHKLVSLEAMADNLDLERGQLRQASPTTRKAGERNVAKCSTSPFKCISVGLAQQINFEIDEELYSNRCRIDKLEDLAASRQREIFRLNKKLAEAETMTYDVIRDLLGVKSDIATHATYLDNTKLEGFSKMACHHTKTAIHKEKELEALRELYNEERASWLEDIGRRQAEVVAARVAVEHLRQKDFILKAENKRLKADLSRQKKRLLQLQDKMKASLGQGNCHQSVGALQDNDLQEELRRTETLLNHVNNDLGRHRARSKRREDYER